MGLFVNTIKLLEQNPEKIFWSDLCRNPEAMRLLEKNQDKIDWLSLSENPSIFKKDLQQFEVNFSIKE